MHFHGNNIDAEGAVDLADGLISCNNLQELWLSNNDLGSGGKVALRTHLKGTPYVVI